LAAGAVANVFSGGSENDLTIGSGGSAFIYSAGSIMFTNISSGGIATLLQGAVTTATDMRYGAAIDLTFLPYTSGGTAALNAAENLLTVTEGGVIATQSLSGTYNGAQFSVSDDGSGGTLVTAGVTAGGTPCFCRGTLIRTPTGDVPIEQLAIGDPVVTLWEEVRPIRWIGTRSYPAHAVEGNREILPILIRRAALCEGIPARDLYVSPKHALYLDGVLIPAECLVNGKSILQPRRTADLSYFHIELDSHDVLIAEGAAAESFVDCDSRVMFQNAATFAQLYPGGLGENWCFRAPRLEQGTRLESLYRRIATRALAESKMTGHMGLHGAY
jgi:hypothetical protein